MKYKYSDLTEKIIGAAMKIHRSLGNGYQEVIYHRCLEIEFRKLGLTYERERVQKVFYEGECVGTRRVDFLIEGKILIEIKAIIKLENAHLAQSINYLEAFDLEVGLLINFGGTSLEYKRLYNKRLQGINQSNHKII
jgi:GxxExxY protein